MTNQAIKKQFETIISKSFNTLDSLEGVCRH